MGEELNYLDLVILKKIDHESSVEKFGTQINTSFFETANILGGMKIKGLIEIQSSIGGQSQVTMTTHGSDMLAEAAKKYAEPLDALDNSILHTIGGGVRELYSIGNAINIRAKDLAFHLYKLKAGDYIDHEVRSGKVNFSLTEKGFNLVGVVRASHHSPDGKPAHGANVPAQPASGADKPQEGGIPPVPGIANSGQPKPSVPSSVQDAQKKPLAGEDEIADILNFDSFRFPGFFGKKKETTAKPYVAPKADPKAVKPLSQAPSASVSPSAAPILAQKPAAVSSAPINANQNIAGQMNSTAHPQPIQPTGLRQPSSLGASPAGANGGQAAPGKLDKQAMLMSKLEFYAKNYAIYAIVALFIIFMLAYFALTAISSK